jgi:hypothetical protein
MELESSMIEQHEFGNQSVQKNVGTGGSYLLLLIDNTTDLLQGPSAL